ncbi:MAG: hypothetical protein ACI915_005181, partial [Gammaproteobacteria bacterium]
MNLKCESNSATFLLSRQLILGPVDLSYESLLKPDWGPARQSKRCVAALHERAITPLDADLASALGVARANSPLGVAARLFGTTKLRSPRLDWQICTGN